MNERIQELSYQCWYNDPDTGKEEFNRAKFAELIIREFSYDCMDVTDMSHHIVFVAKKWGVEL